MGSTGEAMRSLGIGILFLVAASTVAHSQAVERWVMVSVGSKNSIWLVDTQSISSNQAWVVTAHPNLMWDEEDKYFYNYVYARQEFDCSQKRSRVRALDHKDSHGKSVWSKDNLTWDWSYVRPGTTIEGALEYICGKKDPKAVHFADPEQALRTAVTLNEDEK